MLQLDDPLFDPVAAKYAADMEALANRALAGQLSEREYREQVERLTLALLTAVFLLGGGDPTSPEGERFLTEQQRIARDSARGLAGDLFDGRYSEDGERTADEGKESLIARLALWTFTLGAVYHKAQVTAPIPVGADEPRKRWDINPAKQNCEDCLALDGVVLTLSEWDRTGIYPQSFDLFCKGFSCGCRWRSTDEPSVGFENVRFG